MLHHNESMRLAGEADYQAILGNREAARENYRKAAIVGEKAVAAVPDDAPRTLGIMSVSAVSLWLRVGDLERASQLAKEYAKDPRHLPGWRAELLKLRPEFAELIDLVEELETK